MYRVTVCVTLKESVLDPQGSAVQSSLQNLGFAEVLSVRIGKYMELLLDDTNDLDGRIREMCEKLLSNVVIEKYRYEVQEVAAQ